MADQWDHPSPANVTRFANTLKHMHINTQYSATRSLFANKHTFNKHYGGRHAKPPMRLHPNNTKINSYKNQDLLDY